jgi:hypothetical protein
MRDPSAVRRLGALCTATIAALAVSDCGIFDPSADEPFPEAPFIDEPILLEISEPVPAEVMGENSFVFLLGSLLQEGRFNDIALSYMTTDGCDRDILVYNVTTDSWGTLISFPDELGCAQVPSGHAHLFSGRGLSYEEYLDDFRTMRIRGDINSPQMQAVRMNEEYFAIPLVEDEFIFSPAIAFGGEAFWVRSGYTDEAIIWKLSLRGIPVGEFPAPEHAGSVAYGDGSLWTVSPSEIWNSPEIWQLSEDGDVRCSFSTGPIKTGDEYLRDLAWENDVLWLLVTGPNGPRLVSVDPIAACNSGTAAVLSIVYLPEGQYDSFTWTGTHFLVADTYSRDPVFSLVDTEGKVSRTYDVPVAPVYDIAWDGEAVIFLCGGPKGAAGSDHVITRFRLR